MSKGIQKFKTYTYTAASCIFISLKVCLNLAIQLASAIIISNYSPLNAGKGKERMEWILGLWEDCHREKPLWDLNSSSQIIVDPTAATFIAAVMIYCSAVLLYCTMGKGQHRDRFLVFGVLLGAISGSLASWSDSNLELLKDYIPISITGALTLSLVWHGLISWVSG